MVEHGSIVQRFYAGQSVLVTGGTGFLGKLLIEKLLRTCTDLKYVYALTRPKRDECVDRRFEKIFGEALFDRVGREVPKYREKIRVISGDCSLPGLGLSGSDADLLAREISLVFNVAATVRFDEQLKKAIAVNVTGTKELMELCKRMSNLKVVMHVSTAYSNCDRNSIAEKFYPSPISEEAAMQLADNLTEQELNDLEKTLLGPFPNTYIYTKCMAEQLVRRYGTELPIGVFRPAIVVSTYKEPISGWVDNVYGPTGALAGAGIGLLRTMNMDTGRTAELIPADYTVNALIVTAWAVATKRFRSETTDPPIYNYQSSWGSGSGISWGRYMDLAVKHGRQVPSVHSVWCYTFTAAKNPHVYLLLMTLLHLLPAALVDAALILAGSKPRILRIYKRLHKFSAVTSYFCTRDWNFSHDNTQRLWDTLCPTDQALFAFSMRTFDWDDFMYVCVRGLRLHIFKDDPSTIPRAKLRMARFAVLHDLIKIAGFLLILWLSYTIACVFLRVFTGLSEILTSSFLRSLPA